MTSVHRVDARDKPQLLFAMMKVFAADGSRIAFEGNLSDTNLFVMDGSAHEETGALKRATVAPPLDYVVLSLTPARVTDIERAIDSKIAFNGYKGSSMSRLRLRGRSHSLHTTTSVKAASSSQRGCQPRSSMVW